MLQEQLKDLYDKYPESHPPGGISIAESNDSTAHAQTIQRTNKQQPPEDTSGAAKEGADDLTQQQPVKSLPDRAKQAEPQPVDVSVYSHLPGGNLGEDSRREAVRFLDLAHPAS